MLPIVLIGPIGAGKTTVARLLSRRLGIRNVPLDLVRWGYWFRMGFDPEEEARLVRASGLAARFAYWKAFEIDSVEQVLRDYPDTIIDFGAGASHYEDEASILRAEAALANVPSVILLLPSRDPAQSLSICLERMAPEPEHLDMFTEMLRAMISSRSNARLARHTIHAEGRTPEEIVEEILGLLPAASVRAAIARQRSSDGAREDNPANPEA